MALRLLQAVIRQNGCRLPGIKIPAGNPGGYFYDATLLFLFINISRTMNFIFCLPGRQHHHIRPFFIRLFD
ncbi:hypothetical protein L1K70_00325 [Salmonella enterica subsp. enterica serovar Anatum]|nr:hypothetical protein [Salmonella enterica]EJZ6530054.1 hypothetical protein [Salmonella enterica]MCF1820354.1 hypothetical protein [Salmonella enterica subsp. enterica serovar Anatum]